MADSKYSNLTIIIATAKDCGKCNTMKNQGMMDKIVKLFKSKGIKVIEKVWNSRFEPYPGTDRFSDYLNTIVAWFPQFIVLPTSYYENIGERSIESVVRVSSIFNGVYNEHNKESVQKSEYKKFDDENFTKFLDTYLSSPEYKAVLNHATILPPSRSSSSASSSSSSSGSAGSLTRAGLGNGIAPGPNGSPSFSNFQRGVPNLDAPNFTEPASKNKECGKSDFVLFSRGL